MITVFYGQQVYEQYLDYYKYENAGIPSEIRSEGYVYYNGNWYTGYGNELKHEDVPAELKAWVLLLD